MKLSYRLVLSFSQKIREIISTGVMLILLGAVSGFAQSNVNEERGLKPYESWHGGDLDSVSLTNGGLVLHIPLASFPQRGNLDLSFSIYSNTKQWQARVNSVECSNPNDPSGCTPRWIPLSRGNQNLLGNLPIEAAYVASSLDWMSDNECNVEPGNVSNGNTTTYNWSNNLTAPDGNVHSFGMGSSTTNCPAPPFRALDASGILQLDANNVITSDGTRFTFGTTSNTVTDSNGNQINVNFNSGQYTDTLGRVIVLPPSGYGTATTDFSHCQSGTTSAKWWTIPGLSGGTRTFKFCYSSVSIFTNFGQGGTEYPPTNNSLLTAIVLPDSTAWTFSYDNYGDVTRLGFPTGGSISYAYAVGPVTCTQDTPVSMIVTSRTVDANDGSGGHTWTYSYSGQLTNGVYSGTATVTSPDGNETVHTISNPVGGQTCSLFDTQARFYQGSHTVVTLLKTSATLYVGTTSVVSSSAINVVPTQVTTTLPGGQSSKVVNTWDSGNTVSLYGTAVPVLFGSLLQKDEYDFSNTLVRSTLNHYLWQDNAAYKTANLLSLPVSTAVKDGSGTQVAKTTYAYDETAVTASNVSTGLVAPPAGGNIRGNVTSVSRWLNTNNSFLSSNATYLDTGLKASSTDPRGNTTSYTYSSTFAGAYITQTNLPDTQMPDTGASVVHHIISGNYDFNTGLLTSFTDENGQQYSYQYDNMLRLTQGNHPDGGQTKFTYPDPLTVQRQRLIAGSAFNSVTAKFDGLGRPVQSQEVTPSGTVLTDTTYDATGHASTVSNPYYQSSTHSSDPTYGVTTTQYDALGRTIKTIKQDGSVSTAAYNTAPGDGAGSSVVCTTAIDEAGKQRQACTDALGRLVKVIESNPGSTPTSATGWIAVSGSEQSANSQAATSGHGSVTISGAESSATLDPCADSGTGSCPRTVWDTGSVSITVNGHTNSTGYGRFDTPSTLASALASAINGDSAASVTASTSGATLNLTAKTTGASTNYAFTTSSSTNDITDFGVASFAASPVSGTLAGGQNGSSTPDTGTVTATINGTQYSVSYGSGDTASSVAGRLATAISAGSYASASASGTTVNLTSKTAGLAGNYSVAASWTWNSGQFTNPSFTTSTSGSNLTGGYNAGDLNNHPYVTTYQYDTLGNLRCVHQKATDTSADVACTGSTAPSVSAAWRQRFFTYDSLSRLLTAFNPESGLTSYAYDNNGNLTSKTSPAPNQQSTATQVISFCYDAINRVTSKAYGAASCPLSSPVVTYTYDQGTNGIGHLTSLTDQAGSGIYNYNVLGRLSSETRVLAGISKNLSYAYNLDGSPKSITYPSGATVTYTPDSAGRVLSAVDTANNINYVTGATYGAGGALTGFISGNTSSFAGITSSLSFNNRQQPVNMSAASPSATLFSLNYDFHNGSGNNGNVWGITNNKDTTRNQTFTYDLLNRLTSAQNAGTDCTKATLNGKTEYWGNSYTYDAWGNLLTKTPTKCSAENITLTASASNQLQGYGYDAAGNMMHDLTSGNNYTYDQENRITGAAGFTYTYDADGDRVEKSNGTTGTLYWYMTPGIVAESDLSGNLQSEYVFFSGQRVARKDLPSGNIAYYFSDTLKTASVITDATGNIKSESDYYPWGGELQFANGDSNHYKFTGKERDSETGLDYFGARYYGNSLGRFITPDWSAIPVTIPYADLTDPQSLNLYTYVRNIPTVKVDADGHDGCCSLSDVINFTAGAANAFGSDNLLGAGRVQQTTTAGKLGAAVGDAVATVQGVGETLLGGTGEVAGVVLDATGVGAVVGVPLNVASAGLIVHGGSTAINGGVHLAQDASQSTGNTNSEKPQNNLGGGQIGESNGPKPGSAGGPSAGKKATPAERKQALSENNGNCVFCGKKADQVDHSIPRSRNGNNTSDNLQPACASCNQSKNSKTSEEFLNHKNERIK